MAGDDRRTRRGLFQAGVVAVLLCLLVVFLGVLGVMRAVDEGAGLGEAILQIPGELLVALLFFGGLAWLGLRGRDYPADDLVAPDPSRAVLLVETNPKYPPVIQAALRDLAARGFAPQTLEPLIYRLAWRAGIALPPPQFGHFGACFLVLLSLAILPCAVIVFAHLTSDGNGDLDLSTTLGFVLFTWGLLAALIALYQQSRARRSGVPPWREFKARFSTGR